MPSRIGLDVDGVLANFDKYYTELIQRKYPDHTLMPTWDFGLSKEQTDPLWDIIKSTENFYTTLEIYKGAEDLEKLQYTHQFYFVTSRIPTKGLSVELQTLDWLQGCYNLEFPQVVACDHWSDKAAIYKALRLDSFIDDKTETVQRMLDKKLNCFVYDQPWNAGLVAPRVKTINEYLKEVTCPKDEKTTPANFVSTWSR